MCVKGGKHAKTKEEGEEECVREIMYNNQEASRKIRNMFETLMFLEKQLEGQSVIQDADTVLADILEDVDFEITGIVADLLKIHQNSKDRESVETCFEILTGWTIPDYLKKCIATILEQKNKAVSNAKECLLYQGMHFIPVGK
ncbi:MAG: hypothetical protein ACLSEA_10235, partial [Thomasclavelia ramosa]